MNTRMTHTRKAVIALAICGAAARGFAGPVETVGRKLAETAAPAVVPISAVLRIEAPGTGASGQERPLDLYGTVVSSDGLTVVSATALSPLNNVGDAVTVGGGRATTSASRIRVRLGDGEEVPMRQVLTDEELDLTLLAPEREHGKPSPQWPAPIRFVRGVEADLCDEVFTVGRSGEVFNWAPVIGRQHVICRVDRPRRLYVTAGPYSGGVGTPIFLTDGRPLGLTVVRREPAAPRPGNPLPFQQAIVVVPADDLADMIEQAHRAKDSTRPAAATP